MIRGIISLYTPNYPRVLTYMLQGTEYQPGQFLRWFWRTNDFSTVMKRRQLVPTKPARLLLLVLSIGMTVQAALALYLLIARIGRWELALALYLAYPIVWAHLIVLPLIAGRMIIARPKERRLIEQSKRIFANHTGTIIAVAGSYGKTTMKELLATVLAEGKKVIATPGNKNVAVSHARFADNLAGDEDILIIEYGEGEPGDIVRFADTTKPDIGIITGLAPAHLDRYPTLEAAGRDIFSLSTYLKDKPLYVNIDAPAVKRFMHPSYQAYSQEGVAGWKISDVHVDFEGTRFVMRKGNQKLQLHSGLLGRHQVGPLALVAVLGISLGMSQTEVERGIAKTVAFEHRLQPRLVGGAWVIDDTYNGNIDGIRAGLALLDELPAKRKIYVTPGLVDQGIETEHVHKEMGKYIAQAKPDKVVLMRNSATDHIQAGLVQNGYAGDLSIETDPLRFYTNLDQFIAAGDLVLMQNDWTDNYV